MRLWHACQNFLQESGSELLWSGKPCRMIFLSCWYSSSSNACFLSSCILVLSCRLPSANTLISAMDGSGVLFSSYSDSTFAGWDYHMGQRERASGTLLVAPLHHTAVKLYTISLVWSLRNLGFSILSKQWLLSMDIKGLWSLIIVKCSNPARNVLHLDTTQATAKSSNLMIAQ